jgi:mRNA interferase RelE/StbE
VADYSVTVARSARKELEALWRIRVGDYRVVYAVYDDKRIVDIVAVRHRSKAYE